MKKIFLFLIVTTLAWSCSSSDGGNDNGSSPCPQLLSQAAQGSFRGESFTSPGGTYLKAPGDNGYIINVYVKNRVSGSCAFPVFDGNTIQDVIKFSIPSLALQTITLSQTGSNTLNFNRIADEGNGPVTSVELATCGTVNITNHDVIAETLSGNLVAKGQDGSTVNGSFVLDLCEF